MDWIIPCVAIFGAIGVLWALRDYFTNGGVIDGTDPKDTAREQETLSARDHLGQ